MPDLDDELVVRVEDVLELYARPFNSKEPSWHSMSGQCNSATARLAANAVSSGLSAIGAEHILSAHHGVG